MNTASVILTVLIVFLTVPPLIYISVKLGTLGFLRAKQFHFDNANKGEKIHGKKDKQA